MVLTGESDVIGTGESTMVVETDESSSPTGFSVTAHVECGINTSKMLKCMGYMYQSSEDPSLTFPFQLLKEESDFVYENKRLHSKECYIHSFIHSFFSHNIQYNSLQI